MTIRQGDAYALRGTARPIVWGGRVGSGVNTCPRWATRRTPAPHWPPGPRGSGGLALRKLLASWARGCGGVAGSRSSGRARSSTVAEFGGPRRIPPRGVTYSRRPGGRPLRAPRLRTAHRVALERRTIGLPRAWRRRGEGRLLWGDVRGPPRARPGHARGRKWSVPPRSAPLPRDPAARRVLKDGACVRGVRTVRAVQPIRPGAQGGQERRCISGGSVAGASLLIYSWSPSWHTGCHLLTACPAPPPAPRSRVLHVSHQSS